MKKFNLLFIVIICIVIGSKLHAQEGSISGLVIDAGSGKSLSYVHVQLLSVEGGTGGVVLTALTNPEGEYHFSHVESGQYSLKIRYLGYQTLNYPVVLKDGESVDLKLGLNTSLLELGEISVSSLRYDQVERDVISPVEIIPRDYFPKQSALTISDVVSREPGIALYRDGAWGTSLSVRGLGENRLVTMVNGNRIETSTDLAGGLSMVDVNDIERVEILKGASSSIYGTGAMGGIVNIITKRGNYQETKAIHGEVIGQYEGVNRLVGTHIGIESGGKSWFARFSGGYRNADDIRTPEGILENSQFNDINFNASIGIRPAKNHEFIMEAQEFRANDVGIPGGAPFGPLATANYILAERRMLSGKYTIRDIGDHLQELSAKYYNQFIGRDVLMIPNVPPRTIGNNRITANKVTPKGFHYTNGLLLESKWKLSSNNRLLLGLDIWQRRIETSREKYITQEILDDFQMVQKVLEIERGEQPIPDARFSSAGIFIQDKISLINEKLDLSIGMRLDGIQVSNDQSIDPISLVINGQAKDPVPGQRSVFEAQTKLAFSWSANAGAMYHLSDILDITTNIGRSFRSPSLEERFKYIDLGSKVRVGDPNLKPEKGWFGDFGVRLWHERITTQINGFTHYLTDMIVEAPGEFEYQLISDGDITIVDTLPALINTNLNRALLTGFEVKVNYLASTSVVILGRASYVRGIDIQNNGNLPLIPPFSSSLGIRYQLPGVFSAEWTTKFVAQQNKLAMGETYTAGYFVSDVSLFSAPKKLGVATFQLFAGVDNIFNKGYVNHLATNRGMVLVEPGRNVFIKLHMKF